MSEEKKYVLGFYFKNDRVVLIEKQKPARYAGKLNGVGGKIEQGESPIEAMRREFKEETGAEVYDWTNYAVLTGVDALGKWEMYVFRAFGNKLVTTAKTEPVREVGLDFLLTGKYKCTPDVRWLVSMALCCNSYYSVIEDKMP